MKVKDVVLALEQFSPLPLQESFDNSGLQVGLTETEVSGALLCLDVTETVVDEAMKKGCNMVIAHHPLIFHKLSCVSEDTFVQRIVYKAIQNNIAIVAMHTNLDNALNGVNFKIAEKLSLQNVQFLGAKKEVNGIVGASGVMGNFVEPMSSTDFVKLLKHTFNVDCLQCNELLNRSISRVAICGGSGSFMLNEAVKAGADAFITGEMHYHDYFDWEQKIQIAVMGHYQSEQYTTEVFQQILNKHCSEVPCYIAETNTNPIIYL